MIHEAADVSIPATKKKYKKQVSWWNEDCQRATSKAKAAFNGYKKHNTT